MENVELKFTYRGNKDRSLKLYYHTPNIIDGGYCIQGFVKQDNLFHAFLMKDSICGEIVLHEICFELKKNKEYIITTKDNIEKLNVNTNYYTIKE